MMNKKSLIQILFLFLVFTLTMLTPMQANDTEKSILTRSANGFKQGGILWTGGGSMGNELQNVIIKVPRGKLKEALRQANNIKRAQYASKRYAYVDKITTAIKIYDAGSRGDYVGIPEEVLNSAGSSLFAEGATYIVIAAGATNPIGIFLAAVGGAITYSAIIQPTTHDGFDAIRDILYEDKKTNTPTLTEEEKLEISNKRREKCLELWAKNKRAWDIHKKRVIIGDLSKAFSCKQYGIDVYDLCPYDPNKMDPGHCGCKVPDIDFDGDGVYSCKGRNDECDKNPELTKKSFYGKDDCQTKEDWREEQLEKVNCPINTIRKWNNKTNKPGCICIKGMKPDKKLGRCVEEKKNKTLTCKDIKGAKVIYLPGNRYACDCKYPLVWADDKEQKCVTCNERYPGSIPAITRKRCACPDGSEINPTTQRCDFKDKDKKQLTVPSLIDLTVTEARGVLKERGLILGAVKWGKRASRKNQVGTIQNQTPKLGQSILPGSKVDVWIYHTVVPAVVGMSVKDAISTMNKAWFKPHKGREIEIDNKYKWNTIESQSLNAGEKKWKVDLPVTLDVNIKPKKKKNIRHPLIGIWKGYVKQATLAKDTLVWNIRSVSRDGKITMTTTSTGVKESFRGTIKGNKIHFTSPSRREGKHIHRAVLNATWNKSLMTIQGNIIPYMDNKNMLSGTRLSIIFHLKKK